MSTPKAVTSLQGRNFPAPVVWGTVLFVVLLDQLTKHIALNRLAPDGSVPVLEGIFHLTLVRNTGAAFGFLNSRPLVFTVFSALAALIIFAVIALRIAVNSAVERFALALILGGTIGNLLDRVRLGYVVDFFDLKVWPVFNVADSFITVGAVMLAVTLIKSRK
ncbi:MAG: signal peptidase II [Candidatus Omnitrophica bacterium]|nr:signal peptidase II [Candidatus Omnitrophota bacterium]MDD4012748.1 signal peptidase II [Candidatus Omnitrophota bacterium]